MPVFPDDYVSTEPAHWGMFPVDRNPPRQFIPYKPMPGLDDLLPRKMPPRSLLYA